MGPMAALGGIGQLGGQGSTFGNAGPSSVGDTMFGPIDMTGPTVTFAGAGGSASAATGNLPAMSQNTMMIVGAAALVFLLVWKRKK